MRQDATTAMGLLLLLAGGGAPGQEAPSGRQPTVFWGSDSLQPGDAVLLYGDGLASIRTLRVWRLPDDPAVPLVAALTPPSDASSPAVLQPSNASLKFLLPAACKPGAFAVEVSGCRPVVLNRPQPWFLQPERLLPGLMQDQAPPGAKIQLLGKDFLLPGGQGRPLLELRSSADGRCRTLVAEGAEKFSLHATLPADLAPGRYELRVSNGFGGAAAWSDALGIDIKLPEVWPDRVFEVRSFGAKGDDTADDTPAIRAALAAAEKNGGGIVHIPWGTYRLTDWICIPRRTVLRGDDRDACVLKWPVDEPAAEADFSPAAVYADTSYGVEDLSLIVRKVDTAFVDLGANNVTVPELKTRADKDGSHDVFFRRVAFHHWIQCSHPDRVPELWAKRYTDNANPYNFRNNYGTIRNLEVSDCLFQGANQQFSNIRNARILRNSFSNGMGYCWTCLGGGAWHTVAEGNDLRCSSSWGYGMIGLNAIYSAHNVSRNFVHGEREAMTLDISALSAIPAGPVPKGQHPIVGRNIAWFGLPKAVTGTGFSLEGVKAGADQFAGKTVLVLDGPGAGQYRTITRHTPTEFTIDRPWDAVPTPASTLGLWDLFRHMIVYRCEGYDTSAFAQLYGSFFDFTVDSCTVERSQGAWGQSGWFVQYRYNTLRYANAYHPKIGIPGKNREGNSPFGFTGLVDGNLRITKGGSAQYEVPPGKALFVKDVVPHPVPGVRGCIIKGNDLSYEQRIVLAPDKDPTRPMGRNDVLRMTDILIDRNTIRHAAVGIMVGNVVNQVLASGNRCEDVATPLLANPEAVLVLPSETTPP